MMLKIMQFQCLEGHMVFSESMSMNQTLMATRHAKVLHPVSTNSAMGESTREPMTPSKDNGTSNIFPLSVARLSNPIGACIRSSSPP